MVLYADDDEDDGQKDQLLGGSIGCAVVDSGRTKSVCGNIWLRTYIDSLSQKERKHKLYNYNRKPIGPVLVQCSTVVSKHGFIMIAIAIIYIPALCIL